MKDNHLSTSLVFTLVGIILFLVYQIDYFLFAAITFGCIGLFVPWLSKLIHRSWMYLGEKIGFVMNRLILAAVYCLFLLPIALLSRLFRKSPFAANNSVSQFTDRNHVYTASDMRDPW